MTFDRNELRRVLLNLRTDSTDFGVGVYHAGIDETRLFSFAELNSGGFGPHFAALERVGWDSAWYDQEPIFGYYIV